MDILDQELKSCEKKALQHAMKAKVVQEACMKGRVTVPLRAVMWYNGDILSFKKTTHIKKKYLYGCHTRDCVYSFNGTMKDEFVVH